MLIISLDSIPLLNINLSSLYYVYVLMYLYYVYFVLIRNKFAVLYVLLLHLNKINKYIINNHQTLKIIRKNLGKYFNSPVNKFISLLLLVPTDPYKILNV